jgi:hypothetical protein
MEAQNQSGRMKKKFQYYSLSIMLLSAFMRRGWVNARLEPKILLYFLVFAFQLLAISKVNAESSASFERVAIPTSFDGASDIPDNSIVQLPKDKVIDWDKDTCDQEVLFDKALHNPIGFKCKSIDDELWNSLYLMDTTGTLIYVQRFSPYKVIALENGWHGLILSASNFEIFIEIDEFGRFRKYYATDNEIFLTDNGNKLGYPGALVWFGHYLQDNNQCVADFLKRYTKKSDDWSYLATNAFSQIEIIALKDLNVKPDVVSILNNEIDTTINFLYPRLSSKDNDISGEDYRERLFVFIAANSPDIDFLNSKVEKYKEYLGEKVLNIYNNIDSCNQKGYTLWQQNQQH